MPSDPVSVGQSLSRALAPLAVYDVMDHDCLSDTVLMTTTNMIRGSANPIALQNWWFDAELAFVPAVQGNGYHALLHFTRASGGGSKH